MTPTPLVDAHVVSSKTPYIHAEAARGIEMQLREEIAMWKSHASELQSAGDKMLNAWLMPEDAMEYSEWVSLSSDAKSAWYTAKRKKP